MVELLADCCRPLEDSHTWCELDLCNDPSRTAVSRSVRNVSRLTDSIKSDGFGESPLTLPPAKTTRWQQIVTISFTVQTLVSCVWTYREPRSTSEAPMIPSLPIWYLLDLAKKSIVRMWHGHHWVRHRQHRPWPESI